MGRPASKTPSAFRPAMVDRPRARRCTMWGNRGPKGWPLPPRPGRPVVVCPCPSPPLWPLVLAAMAVPRIREAPARSWGGRGLVTAARAVAVIGLPPWLAFAVLAVVVVQLEDDRRGGSTGTGSALPSRLERADRISTRRVALTSWPSPTLPRAPQAATEPESNAMSRVWVIGQRPAQRSSRSDAVERPSSSA